MYRPHAIRGAITYKYIKDKYEGKVIPRPRVEIRLRNNGKTFKLAMLVDSGADTSFIPLEIAEILDIKLDEKIKTSRGASGPFKTRAGKVGAELIKGIRQYH